MGGGCLRPVAGGTRLRMSAQGGRSVSSVSNSSVATETMAGSRESVRRSSPITPLTGRRGTCCLATMDDPVRHRASRRRGLPLAAGAGHDRAHPVGRAGELGEPAGHRLDLPRRHRPRAARGLDADDRALLGGRHAGVAALATRAVAAPHLDASDRPRHAARRGAGADVGGARRPRLRAHRPRTPAAGGGHHRGHDLRRRLRAVPDATGGVRLRRHPHVGHGGGVLEYRRPFAVACLDAPGRLRGHRARHRGDQLAAARRAPHRRSREPAPEACRRHAARRLPGERPRLAVGDRRRRAAVPRLAATRRGVRPAVGVARRTAAAGTARGPVGGHGRRRHGGQRAAGTRPHRRHRVPRPSRVGGGRRPAPLVGALGQAPLRRQPRRGRLARRGHRCHAQPAAEGRPRAPGQRRCAHRPRQPAPVPFEPRRRRRPRLHAVLLRSRRLQGRERPARPPDGRPGAGGSGPALPLARAGRRPAGAHRRRRVRVDLVADHRQRRRRRAGLAPHRRLAGADRPRRRVGVGRHQHRHRPRRPERDVQSRHDPAGRHGPLRGESPGSEHLRLLPRVAGGGGAAARAAHRRPARRGRPR